jgi:hypothetical protein
MFESNFMAASCLWKPLFRINTKLEIDSNDPFG